MKIDKRTLQLTVILYTAILPGILFFYIANSVKDEYVNGCCSNGNGTYIHNSGMKYQGEWKNGSRNGKGTIISSPWIHDDFLFGGNL